MMTFLKTYLVALTIFIICDLTWIGVIAKHFYARHLGYIMRSDIVWAPAIIFYLLFVVGLVFFVIQPALAQGSWVRVLLMGMLFGLVTYATYDLTNHATLTNWPWVVTVVDMIWGSILGGVVSTVTYFIVR